MKQIVTLRQKALKNGGASLFLDYSINGQRYKEYLKLYLIPENTKRDKQLNAETLSTAKTLEACKILEIQHGAAGIVNRKSKLLLADYIESRSKEFSAEHKPQTALLLHHVAQHIRSWQNIKLVDFNEDNAIGLIKHFNKTLSQGSMFTYFCALKAQLNVAVKRKLVQSNKLLLLNSKEIPKKPETTKEYLTLEEIKKLIATPCRKTEYKRAFLFACFTGLRISDICSLTWEQVHRDGGNWQVEERQKKSRTIVYIPLSENAKNILGSPQEGKVFNVEREQAKTMNGTIGRWVKRAGINKHITFHCARHTCATLLLTNGADIYTVSKILGHSSVAITQVYAKVVDEKKRAAVDAIPSIIK